MIIVYQLSNNNIIITFKNITNNKYLQNKFKTSKSFEMKLQFLYINTLLLSNISK